MVKWCILAAAAVVGLAACDDLLSGGDDQAGAVYTMNNSATANYVIVMSRSDDGRLEVMDSVATGGLGSGPDPVFGTDPLTSQDAVILSSDNRLLFAVNAGSNEVTSFRVGGDGMLTPVSRVSSGGTFPVSLSARNDLLYVVNQKGGGNISGFRVANDGTLTPLVGSTRPLSGAANPSPASVRISPDGGRLVVTEKATNLLTIYPLDASGLPGTRAAANSPGPTPFGADFDPSGRYILSIGNIGPGRAAVPDGSSAASLTVTGTSATPINGLVPTTETAACWIQITPDGRYAYTTNTGSGTVTGFSIGGDGTLTRLTGDGRTGVTGNQTEPLDMAFADGHLYVLTPGDRGIHVFRVNNNGTLTERPDLGLVLTFPISVTGLAAY